MSLLIRPESKATTTRDHMNAGPWAYCTTTFRSTASTSGSEVGWAPVRVGEVSFVAVPFKAKMFLRYTILTHRDSDPGVFHVIYNCQAKGSNTFQDAPGTCNWIIGFKGGLSGRPVVDAPRSYSRFDNQPVQPRSLYWSQLVARMGGDIELVKRNVGAQARLHPPEQCS